MKTSSEFVAFLEAQQSIEEHDKPLSGQRFVWKRWQLSTSSLKFVSIAVLFAAYTCAVFVLSTSYARMTPFPNNGKPGSTD